MVRLLRPLARPVTYTRWLHLAIPMAFFSIWTYIEPNLPWLPVLFVVPLGLPRWMRLSESLQAQLLLEPHERSSQTPVVSAVPAATWTDRWRTVLWLETRLLLSLAVLAASAWLPLVAVELVIAAAGGANSLPVVSGWTPRWWWALGTPALLAVAMACVVGLGALQAELARRLLGLSPGERLAALEERTERLLERNRIARELHDSIGHALTVAVVQAGAARAAGDPEFTDRALGTIEETGRTALEDLERMLLVLRESTQPVSQRPTLVEADRLLESARASGAEVEAKVSGPLETLPGPVSREGYRILQEALTNVLRHSGPVPVRVVIDVTACGLDLRITNPLPRGGSADATAGSGLRGIRERAALLGGEAWTGPREGEWRVNARLPVEGLR